MFQNDELKNHIETSSSISTKAFVAVEWNLNNPDNILTIGNYRYRPTDSQGSLYRIPALSFDPKDEGYLYTDATYSDTIIDGTVDSDDIPVVFLSRETKENLLFSLEDCFGRNRPRSGINKARYFDNKYVHNSNPDLALRPRYYVATKDDQFKYWTSYRKAPVYKYTYANNVISYGDNPKFIDNETLKDGELYSFSERGIAKNISGTEYFIDDASPFVVYKNAIPVNRIVVKVQTNVGSVDLGPFYFNGVGISDPLYGDANKTVPVKWKVQGLVNNRWVDVISFDQNSRRADGSAIFKDDGYVELVYNRDSGWTIYEDSTVNVNNFVTQLVNPPYAINQASGEVEYNEFVYFSGIRLVVDTMNKLDSTLDLIELSPRLVADISDNVVSFNIKKSASDLGISGMPVGQLLASTGDVSLFDPDLAFSSLNPNSIIADFYTQNVKFSFFDIIEYNNTDYFVPLKTMYIDGFPKSVPSDRSFAVQLRDLFFYFEQLTAPQMILQDVSLSYAIAVLLDSIGFSNYVFYRTADETDFTIPYFYVPPDTSVAQLLNDLAVSSQTAMFFDEYNNFVCMSKNYILPSASDRPTDMVLYGSYEEQPSGVLETVSQTKQPNIIDMSSQENQVFNSGILTYSTKYIQKSYRNIKQAMLTDQDKTWIYKPVLLWEATGTQATKSQNEEVSTQSSYSLSAIPLNSDLSATPPYVANNQIQNNVIDLGEGIYWISRYNGYFYANGEIIRYDAVEYSIPGFVSASGSSTFWVENIKDYQNYFSKIPFNGKLYPTGRVRIYAEPNYEEINGTTRIKNGAVAKHGRGQFDTPIVYHSAGINDYWKDNLNVAGCNMNTDYLFRLNRFEEDATAGIQVFQSRSAGKGQGGQADTYSKRSSRSSIIRNFLSGTYRSETELNRLKSTSTGTVQSSALIMNGPDIFPSEPLNFISYVHKTLDESYSHFGTRVRVVGSVNSSTDSRVQTPSGSSIYYNLSDVLPGQSTSIGGGSGGVSFMLNPTTNVGYYYEIIATTETDIEKYTDSDYIHNVIFYKIVADANGNAIPIKLWGGLSKIIVDDGLFTGQYRFAGEENPTVYDMAVEYEDIGNKRKFYLYLNNKQVATVFDDQPLPKYNNMALFVRGRSKLMFENVYALGYNLATSQIKYPPLNSAFTKNETNQAETFRKYSMSGAIQSTYLSGIKPGDASTYSLYYDEFGTIMREASYFKVRYDKAYPALSAVLSPTFNKIRAYSVSGFTAGAYGAEFLIFNIADTTISLDETTGNYLRIQGVTFTQESQNELTVDEYFSKKSNLSNTDFIFDPNVKPGNVVKKEYEDIKFSRAKYGLNEFSIDAKYIQSQDDANELMGWLVSKVTKPRLAVGLEIFANPMIQLGDIVEISYKDLEGIDQISYEGTRFTVYNIEYSRDESGPTMTIYLSEVI